MPMSSRLSSAVGALCTLYKFSLYKNYVSKQLQMLPTNTLLFGYPASLFPLTQLCLNNLKYSVEIFTLLFNT